MAAAAAAAAGASASASEGGAGLPPLLSRPTLVMQVHDVSEWVGGVSVVIAGDWRV
jgi:hypothetical protein